MRSILVQIDEETYRGLSHVAPSAKRKRAEFIREAIKDALRRHEFEKMREAYLRQPDSAAEADDWSTAEEFEA